MTTAAPTQAAAAEIRAVAARLLGEPDPLRKTALTLQLARRAPRLALDSRATISPCEPAYPAPLRLVEPVRVAKRSLHSAAGRIGLLHSLAHIELNAVHIALDAVARFAGLPAAFYHDWLSVARDEAYHFRLLARRLRQLGAQYGDLPAHQGLWDITAATNYSALARMALVPRILEARGLDAAPAMIDKLTQINDHASAAIVQTILTDEVRHVAIGNHWFYALCAQAGCEPIPTFATLAAKHSAPRLKPPFNVAARAAAGFSAAEMAQFTEAAA